MKKSLPIITVGDLLDRVRKVEIRIERYCAKIRDQSQDNGLRLLTYYLARRRRRQDQTLPPLDRRQIERIRKARLPGDIVFDPDKLFPLLNACPAEIMGGDLLQAAVNYQTALVGLYRSILQQPVIAAARPLLKSFIRVDERDIVMLKKMSAMRYF
jgi:hypothetical protein